MQNVTVKLIMTFMSLCECRYYAAGNLNKKKKKEKKSEKSPHRTVYHRYQVERSSILGAQQKAFPAR